MVLAGAGSNSTATAVRLARQAAKAGADGTLQVTPYYNKPTQEGLKQHFRAVATAVDLPIILYNVPRQDRGEHAARDNAHACRHR